jgi:hypothetical protein
MFKINQYLQYKNTPDGKPRVLKLPSQYEVFTKDVETPSGYILTTKPIIKQLQHITYYDSEEGIVEVSLSDCRPLLSVETDGVEWTEGDVCVYNQELFTKEGGSFSPAKFVGKYGFIVFDGYQMNFELYDKMFHLSNAKQKQGSFFDDPAKYSKLLWNCSEEEGWQKVFKLLDITIK